MREALMTLKFTEDSGIGGAQCFMTEDIELTEAHIKVILQARDLQASGKYREPKLKWWKPEDIW